MSNKGATQSLYESLAQSFDDLDLQQFLKMNGIASQTLANIIGPNDPNACQQV